MKTERVLASRTGGRYSPVYMSETKQYEIMRYFKLSFNTSEYLSETGRYDKIPACIIHHDRCIIKFRTRVRHDQRQPSEVTICDSKLHWAVPPAGTAIRSKPIPCSTVPASSARNARMRTAFRLHQLRKQLPILSKSKTS